MNTEYGTLTIRREINAPDRNDPRSARGKLVTLATYRYIDQEESKVLIERFCAANQTTPRDLFCTWSLTVTM